MWEWIMSLKVSLGVDLYADTCTLVSLWIMPMVTSANIFMVYIL